MDGQFHTTQRGVWCVMQRVIYFLIIGFLIISPFEISSGEALIGRTIFNTKSFKWANGQMDKRANGQSLYGIDVFKSDIFQCGEEHHLEWVNNLGEIRIYQSQVWMGMYAGDVADLSFEVHRRSDGTLLHRGNWDHYRDPVGIGDQIQLMNWTPNYIRLEEGDALEFIYGCYKKGTAEIVVTMWYARK